MSRDSIPDVSVILSCYNAQNTIQLAIESVLNQTYTNFELLISDDHSEDQTLKLIQQYIDPESPYYDHRVKLIPLPPWENNHPWGLAYGLNALLQQAQGTWIARMDADDICFAKRLEVQREYMLENPHVDIVGSYVYLFEYKNLKTKIDLKFPEINPIKNNKTIKNNKLLKFCETWIKKQSPVFGYPNSHEKIALSLLIGSPFCHPSVFMKKKFLDQYNLSYPQLHLEDYALWVDCYRFQATMANIKTPLLGFSYHKYNKTKNIPYQIYLQDLSYIHDAIYQAIGVDLTTGEHQALNFLILPQTIAYKTYRYYLKELKSVFKKTQATQLFPNNIFYTFWTNILAILVTRAYAYIGIKAIYCFPWIFLLAHIHFYIALYKGIKKLIAQGKYRHIIYGRFIDKTF